MAVSAPFRVPRKPVQITVTPAGGSQVIERGQAVKLTAVAYSPDTGSLDPNTLEWVSDLQESLGNGSQLSLSRLRTGKHTLTVRARAADGTQVVTTLQVEVREPQSRKHTSRTHPGHREADHKTGSVPSKPKGE
jgi:hypothetical protein